MPTSPHCGSWRLKIDKELKLKFSKLSKGKEQIFQNTPRRQGPEADSLLPCTLVPLCEEIKSSG